jgi:fibronectin-binding autotransporter adhesin
VTFTSKSNNLIQKNNFASEDGGSSNGTFVPPMRHRAAGLKVTTALVNSAALLCLSMIISPVAAQTWVGPGTDFTAGENWDTGIAPNTNDVAVFSNTGPAEVQINSYIELGGIVFTSDAKSYTISTFDELDILGDVVNLSGVNQKFSGAANKDLAFWGSSSLGSFVDYDIRGGFFLFDRTTGGSEASVKFGKDLLISGESRIIEFGTLNSAINAPVANFSDGDITLRIGNLNTDSALSGSIVSHYGSLHLEKVGAGTLTLAGEVNDSASITISSGVLQVGNGSSIGTLGSAAVSNNASLVFNRFDTHTVSNAISGTGSVTHRFGTTILTGQNTYSGGTVISAGTLQIGNGGETGSLGSGPVINNGSLILNRRQLSVANAISGTGSVTINGLTILTGLNTYTGGTFINQTLGISSDNALGASSGRLTFNNGTLSTTASLTSSRSIFLVGNGNLAPDVDTTLTLTGNITGEGSITKTGRGELVLRGENNYSGNTVFVAGITSIAAGSALGAQGTIFVNGGDLRTTADVTLTQAMNFQGYGGDLRPDAGTSLTLSGNLVGLNLALNGAGTLTLIGSNRHNTTSLTAGTLQVGNGGTTGTLGSGAVTNNSSLVFNRSDTHAVASPISGAGSVTHAGSGTTILTGANTYSGMTSINSGTLRVGDNGTSGSLGDTHLELDAGGKLAFSRSNNLTVGNKISGFGSIVQAGSGRLTLTSDLSDFQGDVSSTDGILDIKTTLGSPAGGYRAVSVEAGGALTGSGRIGVATIASEGQLIGNAGQTLHMDALALNSGSVVTAYLGTPSGSAASLFNVVGDLELNGQLNIVDQGGFSAGVYRLFDYGGQLTGAGLRFGDTPAGVLHTDLALQTNIEGRVNLISSAGVDLRFWDGSVSANRDNNIVDGGSGTWTSDAQVWTDPNGLVNGTMKPNPAFTVFQGIAGTVTLDDSVGALAASGMQFLTDGYSLTGDGLTLAGAANQTVIRVGDGSAGDAAITAMIGADLISAGDLVKRDGGTLVLTGDNSYRDTVVVAGTLIGNSSSLSGDIFNAGTVVFDQADDATYAGTVAGLDGSDGRMAKRGTGTLTLTGNSGLDWDVQGGSLVTTADLFSGNVNIAEGANVAFDQRADANYSGVASGAGQLIVSGGRAATFSGDSSAFGGNVDVRASSLIVNGALGGAVSIGSGSTLAGSGTLGNVSLSAGATIRPGNSIGTLTVGDISFAAGSVYEVEVDPASDMSDLIAASGTATLNGGSVVHIGLDGSYRPTHTYTILTAAGGVNGQFGNVSSDFAFLIPTLGYTGNEVTLTLARNDVNFDGVAQTFNQVATANALEGLGFGTPLYDVIIGLNDDSARRAFDGFSGEVHASVQSTLMEHSHFIRTAALDRMRTAGASVDATRGATWWTQGLGSWGHIDSNGNASRISHSAKGVLMGVDTIAAETVQLGVYGGWQKTEMDIKRLSSDAKADSYHLGAYAGWDGDNLSLRGGVSYSWHNAEIARRISLADFHETIRSDRGISQAQAFAELAYRAQFGSIALEPFAGIVHVAQNAEATIERGGDAALRVDHASMGTTFTTLGARASNSFGMGGLNADIRASGGWRRALGDRMPVAELAFEASTPFTVRGGHVAKNAFALDAGLGVDISSRARFDVAYGGSISSATQSHSGRATFSLAF